jgi:hypothetical protein
MVSNGLWPKADHVPVDPPHDLIAPRNRQRAAGAEIVLNVDDDQNFIFHKHSFQRPEKIVASFPADST